MTENNESLLRPVPPGDWRDNAIICGRLEDDSVLAMGYLKAAEILVAHWPKETQFDLPGTAETLYDAGTLLLHGVSGVLGAYAEYQEYLRQEADQS